VTDARIERGHHVATKAEDAAQGWRAEAACRDVGPDVMVPETAHTERGPQIPTSGELRALAVCATCPVTQPCLEYALAIGRSCAGVWGGKSEVQRRSILRRRADRKRS
jgi:WhiB family transcriptional regulator, redox-sensing transcriptional regulator